MTSMARKVSSRVVGVMEEIMASAVDHTFSTAVLAVETVDLATSKQMTFSEDSSGVGTPSLTSSTRKMTS